MSETLYSILILAAALVTAVILKFMPILSYPFRLFFTMIHEMGHAFAARLTGGDVERFTIDPNGAGRALTRGGDAVVIFPAGYLGTALFSAGLMVLSGLPAAAPYSLGILGGMVMILTLLYGRSSCLTFLVGLFFGTGFMGLAWGTPPPASVFMLNLLAIQGGLTSLDDLRMLRRGVHQQAWVGQDDASRMAQHVGCSPLFWAWLWFACSALALGAAIWLTWFQGLFG